MPSLITKIANSVIKMSEKFTGLSQGSVGNESADKSIAEDMPALLRRAAAEGAVLLKNNGVLPFEKGAGVSVFGRVQLEWFYTAREEMLIIPMPLILRRE